VNILKKMPFDKNFILITLVDYQGSVPQALGAKAIVTEAGLFEGTVGGGKVEAKAILFAQELLKKDETPVCQLIEWNLTRDVGMTCGGVVNFLFEVHKADSWKIVVFGAGHVAQELVPMLTKLNCQVTCVDNRREWLERLQAQENLKTRLVESPKDIVGEFSSDCFFVFMTQGHSTDLPIVKELLKQHAKAPYIGVIGSKTKATVLRANLKEAGFSSDLIQKIHCPIGLDIGNNMLVEIAFSVVAQLLQVRGST
jgi:xanthine dehydrogenase accessory factor